MRRDRAYVIGGPWDGRTVDILDYYQPLLVDTIELVGEPWPVDAARYRRRTVVYRLLTFTPPSSSPFTPPDPRRYYVADSTTDEEALRRAEEHDLRGWVTTVCPNCGQSPCAGTEDPP